MALSGFFQEREVLLAGDSCGTQVVHDDEHRNGPITWDDNRTLNPRFGLDTMVTLFTDQLEAGEFKHSAQALVRKRCDSGHARDAGVLEGQLHVLGRDERRGAPTSLSGACRYESLFPENILQGADPLAFFEEQADGLRQALPGLLHRIATAGHPQFWAVADESGPFLKNQRREFNLHHPDNKYTRSTPKHKKAFLREALGHVRAMNAALVRMEKSAIAHQLFALR